MSDPVSIRSALLLLLAITGATITICTPARLSAAEPPGKAVYERACASCHDNAEATRAPSLTTLQAMRPEIINFALTQGKMQMQGAGLEPEDKAAVVNFLAANQTAADDDWTKRMACPADRRPVDLGQAATVGGFGFDLANHRRLSAEQAGLQTQDLRHLELAWAIGFPDITAMRSQPAVIGSTLFLPVADASQIYAIDVAGDPCLKWIYQSETRLRTSAAFGQLSDGRKVVMLGDVATNVHMIDAATGQRIWKRKVGLFPLSITTGTPVLFEDRVYVPISQYEIALGADPGHECCKTHGAVTALNALTGAPIWTAHTMPDAEPVRDRGDGKMLWGPSGAPIWSSPAIDVKRGVLYVGTGEATSEPAEATTDAILAIDLKDGSIRWHFQATANDIFLNGCAYDLKASLNCPKANTVNKDFDFGASVIIAQRPDGSDILLAGQKSGTLWALDPDRSGAVLWHRSFGEGSSLGGIHWGLADDGTRVFAPINRTSNFGSSPKEPSDKPGIHAVTIADGSVVWSFGAEPDCADERKARVGSCASIFGLSGAPTIIDGAVIAGSLDGILRAFDAKTGDVLFAFDTARSFQTINGVKASGGAIDNASIVAANGMLFVNSGYGLFQEMPGNVLLAFRPKR